MWKPNFKNIEKAKDILLVVLFLMTILLLYFFWRNDSFDTIFKLPKEQIAAEMEYKTPLPSISQIVQPEEISVCFGNTKPYTKVCLENNVTLWQSAIHQLKEFGKSETILVEEITKQQYQEIMKYRSVEFRFSYDIPFVEFLEHEKIKKYQNVEAILGMGTLAYSDGSKESIFIYQYKDDKYYRLVSNSKEFNGFSKIIDEIEASDYVTYHPSAKYFGINTNESTLIPVTLQSNLEAFSYQPENKGNENQKEKLKELSGSFFGESLDFVRRIVDSKGAVIYMYGYGQKVFTINTDGTFEYKEVESEVNNTNLGFYDALDTTLHFVANRGGWQSLNGARLTPYLKTAKIIEKDKKKEYIFTFGVLLNNHRIYYQKGGDPIVIQVYGNQVIHYKRNMIDFDNSLLDNMENVPYKETFPAVNVPAVNLEYLKDLIEKQEGDMPKNADRNFYLQQITFDQIAEQIEGMEACYVRIMDEEESPKLQPAWILKMKQMDVYFDLYNQAEPIGYTYR